MFFLFADKEKKLIGEKNELNLMPAIDIKLYRLSIQISNLTTKFID